MASSGHRKKKKENIDWWENTQETSFALSFSTLLLIQGFFPPILYIFSSSFQKFYSDVSKCFVLHPLSLFFFDLQSFQILWLDFVGQF